jgi:hypothetical protein
MSTGHKLQTLPYYMTRNWKQQSRQVSFVEGMTNGTTINNIQKQSMKSGHTLRIDFLFYYHKESCTKYNICVIFEFLTTLNMSIAVLWDVTPTGLAEV